MILYLASEIRLRIRINYYSVEAAGFDLHVVPISFKRHSGYQLAPTYRYVAKQSTVKMPHAAPSRAAPTANSDLEAGAVLKLGEYQTETTLNLSEARIILQKTLATRAARGRAYEETETTIKTKDYLEIFAVFKDLAEAQQVEGIINSYGENLERFEKSQLGSLVPTCADEAKALIPSLEKKVEDGIVSEDELDGICKELQRLKRQAQL